MKKAMYNTKYAKAPIVLHSLGVFAYLANVSTNFMARLILILTILLQTTTIIFGQTGPVKIRISKGQVGMKENLYENRRYIDQVEYNLTTKDVLIRKNESKSFHPTKYQFPSFLSDSSLCKQLDLACEKYLQRPCQTPEKNFFYKIDLIYCTKYPSYIKTFEVAFNPLSDKIIADDDLFQKIIRFYTMNGK